MAHRVDHRSDLGTPVTQGKAWIPTLRQQVRCGSSVSSRVKRGPRRRSRRCRPANTLHAGCVRGCSGDIPVKIWLGFLPGPEAEFSLSLCLRRFPLPTAAQGSAQRQPDLGSRLARPRPLVSLCSGSFHSEPRLPRLCTGPAAALPGKSGGPPGDSSYVSPHSAWRWHVLSKGWLPRGRPVTHVGHAGVIQIAGRGGAVGSGGSSRPLWGLARFP